MANRYSALPMEDMTDVTMNPFGDPSVQRTLSAGTSAQAQAQAPAQAPASSSSLGGDLATAALAGFMASVATGGSASGSMAGAAPLGGSGGSGSGAAGAGFGGGPQAFENTLDEPVSTTLVRSACPPKLVAKGSGR